MVATARAIEAIAISDLRDIVLNQLRQTKETSEAQISVSADQGIVTLIGSVKSVAEKVAVETVAKQVRGVAAVANELFVAPVDRTSTQIARDLLKALRGHIFLATEDIRVIVRDRWVTLEGTVHQVLQRMLAEAQIKRLPGIFGFSNQIEVKRDAPFLSDADETGADGTLPNGSAWIDTGEGEAG